MISAGKSWTYISAALGRDTNSVKLNAATLRRAATAKELSSVELGLKAKGK